MRFLASEVVQAVLAGQSLSEALSKALLYLPDSRDQAFVQALCYGVCRDYWCLHVILNHMLDKPLKKKDQNIYALLLIGLYQLSAMRVSPHAAIHETVETLANTKHSWAKGLVNGILRRFQREQKTILQNVKKNREAFYAHPDWMIEIIKQDWPLQWENILNANNQQPPFSLRVNILCQKRDDYLYVLADQKLQGHVLPETKQGIVLDIPQDVEKLHGFKEGIVSVQDGGAQLATELLVLEPGLRVLDACAAPGGKTTHILEIQPETQLIAVEKDAKRLQKIKENGKRLKLNVTCLCADVGNPDSWWDSKPFDRILLDAPCTSSGVIRRHPDIKILRQAQDSVALAKEQFRLLQALWPLLREGGLLLYVTCSIFKEENEQLMQKFLAIQTDASEEEFSDSWGIQCLIGRQILPGMHEMDGFYFARLRKIGRN